MQINPLIITSIGLTQSFIETTEPIIQYLITLCTLIYIIKKTIKKDDSTL